MQMTEEALTYSMFLEVYLHAGVVRGILETNQDRLSSHLVLRQGDEAFSLREATLEIPNRKPVKVHSEYLIYMQEVFLIADLSTEDRVRSAGLHALFVKKARSMALLSVGPYLLEGNVHLRDGSALSDLLIEQSRFLPVTEARLLDRQEAAGTRTFLVNRAKIGFISAIGDGLIEF
jgi:hypothetical protein